jgi:hypothetical protein
LSDPAQYAVHRNPDLIAYAADIVKLLQVDFAALVNRVAPELDRLASV